MHSFSSLVLFGGCLLCLSISFLMDCSREAMVGTVKSIDHLDVLIICVNIYQYHRDDSCSTAKSKVQFNDAIKCHTCNASCLVASTNSKQCIACLLVACSSWLALWLFVFALPISFWPRSVGAVGWRRGPQVSEFRDLPPTSLNVKATPRWRKRRRTSFLFY
jgi:hypothetical protein